MRHSTRHTDLDNLQQQMQEVRGALQEDVDEFVASTRKLTDWKEYVISHPVATTLAAAAVGYALFPTRKQIISPDAKALEKLARRNKLVVQANPTPQQRSGLGGKLFGLASSLLFRGLANYVGNRVTGMSAARESTTHGVAANHRESYQPSEF